MLVFKEPDGSQRYCTPQYAFAIRRIKRIISCYPGEQDYDCD
jgi:hypothetical protein